MRLRSRGLPHWPPAHTACTAMPIRRSAQITRVEWSVDASETWIEARVLEPQIQYSWARFEFAWDAQAGEHTLMTRATDAAGDIQPDSIPFNEKGYLFNQPLPHPILVK